jgi:hypothetical protein
MRPPIDMTRIPPFILTTLPLLALAQQITPPARLPEHLLQRRQSENEGSSTSSANASQWSEAFNCQNTVPGCTSQLAIFDACQAQYGTAFIYLYCLCTAGYYDASHKCDNCSLSVGVIATSHYSSYLSEDDFECSSLAVRYGNATVTPSGYIVGPIVSHVSFSGTAALTSSVAIPTGNYLSGLTGSTSSAIPNAAATSTATNAASATGHGGSSGWRVGIMVVAIATITMVVLSVLSIH